MAFWNCQTRTPVSEFGVSRKPSLPGLEKNCSTMSMINSKPDFIPCNRCCCFEDKMVLQIESQVMSDINTSDHISYLFILFLLLHASLCVSVIQSPCSNENIQSKYRISQIILELCQTCHQSEHTI